MSALSVVELSNLEADMHKIIFDCNSNKTSQRSTNRSK